MIHLAAALIWIGISLGLGLGCWGQESDPHAPVNLIIVRGADGTPEYGQQFASWTKQWKQVADRSKLVTVVIGETDPETNDADAFERSISKLGQGMDAAWIVLIGHGTFSGKDAKINLRGPDVSAQQLKEWLSEIERPVVIVNCASSSAPFINALSGSNRVIITSTRSGSEYNFSRFGGYFAEAIASADSDLDHDEQVSAHEAFLRASAEVKRFYQAEGRLQSEHALIDDNGDGKGTPASMFRGVRPAGQPKNGAIVDGKFATDLGLTAVGKSLGLTDKEIQQRDDIEKQLADLRARKSDTPENEYDAMLEPLMIRLARIYADAETRQTTAREISPKPKND